MDLIATIDSQTDVARLLALDEHGHCAQCTKDDTSIAHAAICDLCNWWLSDAQRDAWQIGTVIDARQEADRVANDLLFKLKYEQRPTPVPVFLIITQHWKAELPHYQLFIPSKGELSSAAKAAGLATEVRSLMNDAGNTVEPLRGRSPNLRSISLHRPLDRDGLQLAMDALSNLVRGLLRLPWAST